VQYKGFLSYSHAADDKLAPSVQSALHRVARPWYRLRSMSIFRDKTGMSATPSLWNAIEKALSNSEYFLLMASPAASVSPWVQKEIAWWLSNRSGNKLLFLLTDGELTWNTGGIDWSRTTALPPQLRKLNLDEPLWVDLRWARTEEKLSFRHSRFRDAILDIASTLLDRSKESLDSEDVVVYKRNRFAAYSAALATLLFAGGAVVEAVRARQSATEAEHQRGIAIQNATEARRSANIADTQRAAAQVSALEAKRQASLANREQEHARRQQLIAESKARESLGRQLAAESVASLSEDPERSIWLGIFAIDATLPFDHRVVPPAEDALHRALQSSSVRFILHGDRPYSAFRKKADIGGLFQVSYCADGKRVGTVSIDRTVTIWDVASGSTLLTHKRGFALEVAFSPDCHRLVTADFSYSPIVWDLADDKPLFRLSGHSAHISKISFSADGQRILTAGEDGTAKVWSAENGSELLTLHVSPGPILAIDFRPDGRQFATAGSDGTVRLWDVPTRREVLSIKATTHDERWNHVNSVAYSRDGKRIASDGDRCVKVWDVGSGKPLFSLAGQSGRFAFSPDNRWLATSNLQSATIWDTVTEQPIQVLYGHSHTVTGLAFSPDGNRLVTSSLDGTARVWNVERDEEVLTFRAHERSASGLAYRADGKLLATSSEDGTAVLWDAATGQRRTTLNADTQVWSVAFSGDGTRLATGGSHAAGSDANAKVWDSSTGRLLLTLRGHQNGIDGVAFSADGRRLGTAGLDGTARVWDLETGRELFALRGHSGIVHRVAFSPDGKLIGTLADDGAVIWDAARGRRLTVLRGHGGASSAFAFSFDSRLIATAGTDRTVILWEASTGRELLSLYDGHTQQISDVAFSPDGNRLATSAEDNTVKLWDAHTGQPLVTLYDRWGPVMAVAFSSDGKYLASTDVHGWVHVYAMHISELIAIARKRVSRALTEEECKTYFPNQGCPELP
jgi:WD40 repeat protein